VRTLDAITPLSEARADMLIGPANRKGGRSVELVPIGDAEKIRASASVDDVDTGRRTPRRKVRYGPGDKHGDKARN
jgi:hypothetical protein